MAYDIKFREKVIEYMDKGHTIKEAHEVFGAGTTTIKGWKKLQKETGSLEKRQLERNHKKIDPEQLKTYINENPDRYMREIAEVFKCSVNAIFLAFNRLKITRKKTTSYVEKNEALRAEFCKIVNNLAPEIIHYVDECGIDEYLFREYAYSLKGTPVLESISGKKFKRTNIVAAKCCEKIVAPLIYDGTTDSVLFECWFENMLLKSVPQNSIFIMDNATFHRKTKLRELAHAAECTIIFLPPYSPDFNPIEKFWAWLKNKLREILPQYDVFMDALVDCFHVE